MKSSILKTHENCQESISLTLRTRSSKKPSRTHVRSWKHQWLLLCLARHATKASMRRPVARQMISSLNLRVSWKSLNPQECVWKNLDQIIMRTILQEERTIHCIVTIWYTDLFLCLKQWRYPQQRQQWINNGRNLKRFRRGTWRKSEVRKRWSMKQGRKAEKFILPHWWTSVIWRMPNWRQKHQKYKGRVVLRGDTVKDDSGSYAVFTEQGSSASQMTAAKVMDIISRLPGCAGQAADAVSVKPRSKWMMLTNCWKFPSRSVQTFGFVYHDTNGRNLAPVWKTQSFLLNEICMVILWQDCYGKGNLRKSHWNTVARRFPIGNAYAYNVKRGYSYLCMWITSNWLERNKI